ncbi:Metallo-dependent phosphatase-like protein [Dichotomopilus funicola]|uniref:Metallo-dependent phosphatase-like protein n=1 Tax=Dichotomopilus funicola TaxID=1934379 RepID=A0AAN6V187_9PEZI|nr:Metallo-dependent phosphatase-like protein [Dichotomopilus funicola]
MRFFSQPQTGLDALLHRPRPSAWDQFLAQPCLFLARKLYVFHHPPTIYPQSHPTQRVVVVCISDTHNSQPKLPSGDVLIHAGDLTQSGTFAELQTTLAWLRSQPHPIKIVVAGNHDLLLDPSCDSTTARHVTTGGSTAAEQRAGLDWGDLIYLENRTVTVTCLNGRQLRVHGSPLTPKHGNWAFQYPRGADNSPYASSGVIPKYVDVLVTHGPPKGHLDLTQGLGCEGLLGALWRARPQLHVFGHVHEGAGVESLRYDEVQRAYEKTVVEGGGVWNLVGVLVPAVWGWLWSSTPVGFKKSVRTLLVNAAVVGGLRDQERRKPVIVVI